MAEDLITTAELLRFFAAEADAERAVAGDGAPDPCPWVGTTTQWVSKMVTRPRNPLPVAVPGAVGRPSLYVPADVRLWFAEEFERQLPADVLISPETGVLLPYYILAREIGMHPSTLAKRIADYAVQPARHSGTKTLYRLRDLYEALLAATKAEDPDALPPSDRDAHWRAEARKDEVMTKRRDLVTAKDAEATLSALAVVLRDACDLIPDALEARCHLPAAALELVVEAIDATRRDISAKVVALRAELLTQAPDPDPEPAP
jgi:hypothetical protein